jgi:uncharacterized protein YcbK (DUF882 family)
MSNIITSLKEASITKPSENSRRSFLKKAVIATSAIAFPNILLARDQELYTRKLSFYHLATGEYVKATYWEDGEYNLDALADIYHISRDIHVNKQTIMDINVIELMYSIHTTSNSRWPYYLTSAYRTQETNEKIPNAAKRSLHIKGQAMDVLLPKFDLEDLCRIAMGKRAGGVGYYPSQNFIHIDVGEYRFWTM